MGCIETKPAHCSNTSDPLDHDTALKDVIAFKLQSITENYDLDPSAFGQGNRGEVRRAVHKATKQVRAIKIIPRKNLKADSFRKETNILRNLDHYNIARTYETYQDNTNFYIVTEFCSGQELIEKISKKGTISEAFVARVMKEVLSAVSYMHKCGVIHRNIKPESLRFASPEEDAPIKITNFALAELFRMDDPKKEFVGTIEYMAPEILSGLYNTSVDVWACGVIIYLLLSGTPPFTGANQDQTIKAIKENEVKFEGKIWEKISPEAKDLIGKMLTKDISQRIHSEAALDHAWFKKHIKEEPLGLDLAKIVVGNLTRFRINKRLQQSIFTFMVHYIATKEDKEKMLKAFKALDTDKDGQLSKEELMTGLKNSVNILTYSSIINNAFENLDKNHTNFIEYTEFATAMIDRRLLLSKDNLKAAFEMLDKDHSGTISIDELKEAFGGEQILFDDKYWNSLMEQGDTNHDSKLDFKEFVDLMSTIQV